MFLKLCNFNVVKYLAFAVHQKIYTNEDYLRFSIIVFIQLEFLVFVTEPERVNCKHICTDLYRKQMLKNLYLASGLEIKLIQYPLYTQ